jgi:hypothetical protein
MKDKGNEMFCVALGCCLQCAVIVRTIVDLSVSHVDLSGNGQSACIEDPAKLNDAHPR